MSAISRKSYDLQGIHSVDADLDCIHHALALSAISLGKATLHNISNTQSVSLLIGLLRSHGVSIEHREREKRITVQGVGIGGLNYNGDTIETGPHSNIAMLCVGLLAPYPYVNIARCSDTNTDLLRETIDILERSGAEFMYNKEAIFPLAFKGNALMLPITHQKTAPEQDVKKHINLHHALLYSALHLQGNSHLPAHHISQDNALNTLFDLPVDIEDKDVIVKGCQPQEYRDREYTLRGAAQHAAFAMTAALMLSDSDVTLSNVEYSRNIQSLLALFQKMGATIICEEMLQQFGSVTADISIKHSVLQGISTEANEVTSLGELYPALLIAAATAQGTTIIKENSELRKHYGSSYDVIIESLTLCGADITNIDNTLTIRGQKSIKGGIPLKALGHDVSAMAYITLGLFTAAPVIVEDLAPHKTTLSAFITLLRNMGAAIETPDKHQLSLLRRKSDKHLVIAIDGPAASGKGTLARKLADYYQLQHLDTGSLYRAAALKLLSMKGDQQCEEDAVAAAQSIDLYDLSNPRLRDEQVGNIASVISAISGVRDALLQFQRNFAQIKPGAILDGRDIGTIVCPDASVKIFVTASIEARAIRRHSQLQNQGIEVIYESVLEDLRERDERDSKRKNAPLVAADDALLLDTTDMTVAEVFDAMVSEIDQKISHIQHDPLISA